MMMAQILRELGAQVLGPAATLAEAQSLPQDAIDAAVLDVNIDGAYIYAFADQLKARQVPLAFVTGYEADYIDERFAASPILAKPIEPQELAAALAGLFYQGEEKRAALAG